MKENTIIEQYKHGRKLFKENLTNIKFDFPASIFSMITIYLPIIYFFVSDEKIFSGVYFALNRFIGAPSLLVAQSFGVTLKQYAAEEYLRVGTCVGSTKKAMKILFVYMIPVYAVAGAGGYIAFHYFLSQEWKTVFMDGWILLPLFILRYFFNCFSNIVYIKGLFKENMLFQLSSTLIAFFSLYLPNIISDKIFFFSIAMTFYYFIYLGYLLLKANQQDKGM
ncbi:TPA: hypothetical protein P7Z02_003515 [Citrobacter koseri]|nr:hypothetical protein [Citrobacter koseri]HDQ2586408.1 hypothetical protein [Citrobacter koseri]